MAVNITNLLHLELPYWQRGSVCSSDFLLLISFANELYVNMAERLF
jgi:hypothetical protein